MLFQCGTQLPKKNDLPLTVLLVLWREEAGLPSISVHFVCQLSLKVFLHASEEAATNLPEMG